VNDKKCQNCETEYQNQGDKNADKCPKCGSTFWTFISYWIGDVRRDFSIFANKDNEPGFEQDIDHSGGAKLTTTQHKETLDLIKAQNRTTHAVRSLAITFVAAPVIALSAIFVITISVISGNTAFIVLTALTAIVICLSVLVAAFKELGKSRIKD